MDNFKVTQMGDFRQIADAKGWTKVKNKKDDDHDDDGIHYYD